MSLKCLFHYDALNVKKHICSNFSDHHIDNSCIQKNEKPIKKILVLELTKFHVELKKEISDTMA